MLDFREQVKFSQVGTATLVGSRRAHGREEGADCIYHPKKKKGPAFQDISALPLRRTRALLWPTNKIKGQGGHGLLDKLVNAKL